MGPLYHLDDASDRVQALNEARRIVRRGRVAHAAAISRWAPRLHSMLVERIHLQCPAIVDMVVDVERTGHIPPVHETSFTGYAHTPEHLRDEVRRSGLVLESLIAVESIAFALADVDERMDDPSERALILDVLRAVESVPDLLGLGPHLLAVARREKSRRQVGRGGCGRRPAANACIPAIASGDDTAGQATRSSMTRPSWMSNP